MLFSCIGRESNPGQLLGKQLCYPLYHQRMWKHIATCMEDYLQFKPCKQSGLLLASVHWWALTLMKVKSSFSATCQSLYVCEGGTQIWTRDLLICSQMLYHWAIPPYSMHFKSQSIILFMNTFSSVKIIKDMADKDLSSRNGLLRWPGIEPGSTAWKAAMLTTIPPTHGQHLFDTCRRLQRVKVIREIKESAKQFHV